jgi:hypothetical protein
MTIAAIPTTYKGIEFRSRLEAKWAVMFNQLGWTWEYEPIDLHGYIPDFHIDFGIHQFFVEIKPAMTTAKLWPALDKARSAIGNEHSETIMVLGGSPGKYGTRVSEDSVWLMSAVMTSHSFGPVDDLYLAICPTCQLVVPLTYHGEWGFPCCPVPEGDNKHHRHELPIPPGLIESYWATAINTIKYRHGKR